MKILKTIKIGQPRDIYELLSLMYINLKFEEHHVYGLCHYNSIMYDRGLITYEEYDKILDYITDNPPLRYKLAYLIDSAIFNDYVFCRHAGFYWKSGVKRPRLKWLKKHMKRNKDK